MKSIVFATLTLLSVLQSAHAADPRATLADLDARLSKFGAARVEGSAPVGGKPAPALFFGERKINGHYDLVDALRKAHNATATVFVREGDEFIRISTNVLTPEGKRGVGTQLARNTAYAAVVKGDTYCGVVDVLGSPYDACYGPIKDASGNVIGATYIGHKK